MNQGAGGGRVFDLFVFFFFQYQMCSHWCCYCDLVHDMESILHLRYLLTAPESLF